MLLGIFKGLQIDSQIDFGSQKLPCNSANNNYEVEDLINKLLCGSLGLGCGEKKFNIS